MLCSLRAAVGGLVFLALSAPAGADEIPRPRLTLALSGGGARGIAHVGVLKALEENGIQVDAIAGTSVGALVGSLYASGHRANQLEGIIASLDWQSLFDGRSDRRLLPLARRRDDAPPIVGLGFDSWKVRLPASALGEYRVNRFLIEELAAASFAAGGDFDRLKIPFRAIATALDNGERVVLSRGSLPRAVRASISIPVALPPVEYEGRTLVDGGLVDNLPTADARALGGDVVVAVDVTSPPLEPSRWQDIVGVASQVTNVLAGMANAAHHAEPDVLIKPDIGGHSFNDYSDFHGLVAKGYEAGIAALPEIRRRLGEASAQPPVVGATPLTGPALEGRVIREIRVTGNARLSESLIRRTFNVPLGPPLNLEKALLALDKVHATGSFDHCWLEEEAIGDDGVRLVLRVKEAPPNRLEIGASFTDSTKAKGTFAFRNRNTFGLGEEVKIAVEASEAGRGVEAGLQGDHLFTPLVGYEASLYAESERPRVFVDGSYVNRAHFERDGGRVLLRHGVKRLALFDAGFVFGRVHTLSELGLPYPDESDDVRLLTGGVAYDVLDDFLYPEAGVRLEARADKSAKGLGASLDYWRSSVSARAAGRLGRRSVVALDAFCGISGGDLPVYELFRIGGPVLLPGWHEEELWGAQALAGAVSFRYRVIGQLRLLARVGAGNVWDERSLITLDSLKVGAGLALVQPTRVGPVSLDFGIREGGQALLTLSVGNP
jgi:NTE family protein